jgi:ABC-type transporter Mla maintaining outer membrane lipid asymmetry permease subunit MlaE
MLNTTVPPAKAKLYAIGLSTLFVLEVGPLLTALLLCGRIGGSYAGKGT